MLNICKNSRIYPTVFDTSGGAHFPTTPSSETSGRRPAGLTTSGGDTESLANKNKRV